MTEQTAAQALLATFLETVNETGEISSERLLIPDGLECNATISKYEVASGEGKDETTGQKRPWFSVTLEYDLDSPEAREAMKRDKVVGFGRPFFLNFLETGGLDPQRNEMVGKLLEICNIDAAGMTVKETLDSFVGQYVFVRCQHRSYTNKAGETVTSANIHLAGPAQ
jgi:hypothetical protein